MADHTIEEFREIHCSDHRARCECQACWVITEIKNLWVQIEELRKPRGHHDVDHFYNDEIKSEQVVSNAAEVLQACLL